MNDEQAKELAQIDIWQPETLQKYARRDYAEIRKELEAETWHGIKSGKPVPYAEYQAEFMADSGRTARPRASTKRPELPESGFASPFPFSGLLAGPRQGMVNDLIPCRD